MKLKLEQHNSIAAPEYKYYLLADNFAVYSTLSLDDATTKYNYIKEVGIKTYIDEIIINKVILMEEEIDEPTQEDKHYTPENEPHFDNMTGHEIKIANE